MEFGIQAQTDHGQFSDLEVVENCRGIALAGANDTQVSYNHIFRNVADGVIVQKSDNQNAIRNDIVFNTIDENSSDTKSSGNGGVNLSAGAESNVVAFNSISRNQQTGVILTSDKVRGVPQKNIVASNLITESSRGGIVVFDRSVNNFIVRNVALNNQDRSAEDRNPDCDKNTWKENLFIPDTTSPECVKNHP